jgi:acyl-CoA thioester hydrolase
MAPFVHRLRVRYVECDMQGHVFNAHYFTWFDVANTELWRAALGAFSRINEAGLDVVVAEAGARFLGGAHFDEDVDVEVTLDPLTTTSMTSHYVVKHEGEILVEGFLRHVCVKLAVHTKEPWPDWIREAVAPYVQE